MAKHKQEGKYKRESLVTVEMDEFAASLFAPERLKDIQVSEPGILYRRGSDVVEERYIVVTRRTHGTWEFEVEHKGVVTRLPAKVLERFFAQRDAIITEGRRDSARNRLQNVAESDQRAAEREPNDADVASFLGGD